MFTIFRAQTIFKFQVAVKNTGVLVLRCTEPKGHIVHFVADPKGTLEASKGTVPFGKGLARTLPWTTCATIVISLPRGWSVYTPKCKMSNV